MSAKKKEAVQEPQIKFADAVKNVAETKGLDTETVATALKEAIEKSYIRSLGGGDDARVEFEIDPETGAYSICQIKTVRDEDDITDDYLEISTEEANEKYRKKGAPKYKPGDDCRIYADNESLSKVFVTAVKNNLRQKLGDAERMALYEQWKDHIGEMVTGTVEKSDDHGTTISIGRTTVELGRRQMIGDERFSVGEPIKVYIQEVKPVNQEGKPQRGPMIEVTRSSEGFLKRLFEEEIREIYEGIVIIKGIAREAGVRSKVAVVSTTEDIDATGACIGQGGSRIQKIVSQLGNGSAREKEKIDIIAWSANQGLYIAESLRPAQVVGVAILNDEEPNKTAVAVVKDDQLSLAIGKKGANVRLANKLTGWSVDILTESEAAHDGIHYDTFDELVRQAEEEKKQAEKEAFARKNLEDAQRRAAAASSIVMESPVQETEAPAGEEPLEEAPAAVAPAQSEPAPAPKAAEPAPEPVKEEKPAAPVKPTAVRTTTTLEDLEKELESEKGKPAGQQEGRRPYGGAKKAKRPRKITEEEVERAKPSAGVAPAAGAMPIYSEEELAEIEAEENEAENANDETYDSDIDMEDYDKYYDDDGK